MDAKERRYLAACSSSLLHDLKVIKFCLGFHACCTSNPFSVRFRDQLDDLHQRVNRLSLDIDDYLFNNCYNEQFDE